MLLQSQTWLLLSLKAAFRVVVDLAFLHSEVILALSNSVPIEGLVIFLSIVGMMAFLPVALLPNTICLADKKDRTCFRSFRCWSGILRSQQYLFGLRKH